MADEQEDSEGRVVQLGATVSGTSRDGVGAEQADEEDQSDDDGEDE